MGSILNSFNPSKLKQHERISFLFRDSVIYGSALAVSRAFSLISFPVVARSLPIAEYGILDLFLTISSFLMTLIVFGQDSAVGRFFYEFDDFEKRQNVISQSLLIQLLTCVCTVGALFIFANQIALALLAEKEAIGYTRIILMQVPFMAAINFSQNLLKWTYSRKAFLLLSIGYAACQASTLLILALIFTLEIELVLQITLFNNIIFGVLGIYFVREWLVIPNNFNNAGNLLRFALPIGFICVLGAIVPFLERQFVEKLLGAEELGFYAAGSKLSMLLALVVAAFQTAWGPFSVSIHRESDAPQTYNLVLNLFSLVICVLVMMLDAFAWPLVTLLASSRYTEAVVVVFPLAIATAVQAVSWVTEIGIGLSKRTTLIIYPYILSIASLTVAMLFLIPLWGLMGAALSYLLAQILRSVAASWLAQKSYPLNWNYAWVFTAFSYTMTTGFFVHGVLRQQFEPTVIPVIYLASSALLGLYFWYRVMNKSNREFVVSWICKSIK